MSKKILVTGANGFLGSAITKLALKKGAISKLKNYVILLSPSAASFDQFQNFEDRGNKFREIVNEQLNESLVK